MNSNQAKQLVDDICEYYDMGGNEIFKSKHHDWEFYYHISGLAKGIYIGITILKHTTIGGSEIRITHNTTNQIEVKEVIEAFAQGEYSIELAENKEVISGNSKTHGDFFFRDC